MDEPREVDLAYRVLDLDLVDAEERRCGKVDDLELEGAPGETTYVGAIVSGTGALAARMPRRLRGLGARIFGSAVTKVGWRHVEKIEAAVVLDQPAADLDLATGDRVLERLIARIVG
jgi:hypothetical protein